jgi:hypothetical protein
MRFETKSPGTARRRGWISLPLAVLLLPACGGDGRAQVEPPTGATPGAWYHDASETHLPASTRIGRTMEARAADFDGDGDRDLLLAKEWAPNVLLLNDGKGRFTDASDRIPQVRRDSEDIAVGDFDGDGDLDAVVSSEDDVIPEYYVNDGAARFTDGGDRLPFRGQANAVVAGDVDGDGDLDLVFGCAGAEGLMLNDGRGTFTDGTAGRIPASSDVTQDVALGDLDGDGDLDLLVANEGGGSRLLVNDGRGAFAPASAAALPPRAEAEVSRNGDLGDADGDGDLDALFANVGYLGGVPGNRLMLNDGRGNLAEATAGRLPTGSYSSMDADFVDLDRDGDLDIVTAGFPAGSRYRVFLNDGSGRFAETDEAIPPSLTGEAVEVEAADYDGDGAVDLYLANFRDPDYLLLRAAAR